ncbi:unnamed protein product [Leptidea sinapis]|uniref:Uncharacterized protein n=1 Tax=Leptidea sinapis TaxID=189913 RepID=A0A5E4R8E4_9NEOP|nr:unnamed protein product [Leptidea sinapis]
MVQLPNSQYSPPVRPSKSTGDLALQATPKNNANLSRSTQNEPQTNLTKTQIKEQKRIQQRQTAERKKQERLAIKERQRLEKENKEKEKKERIRLEREKKLAQNNKSKRQGPSRIEQRVRHSTNTLDSSISRSSGPPPYTPPEIYPSRIDKSGNTSFGEPLSDNSNWDLISQHREQMNRPMPSVSNTMKTQALEYSVGNLRVSDDNT